MHNYMQVSPYMVQHRAIFIYFISSLFIAIAEYTKDQSEAFGDWCVSILLMRAKCFGAARVKII